jgi:hypothetical protein
MAVDTFIAYVGGYPSVADAEADYELVMDLHTEAGLIDADDAALIERRAVHQLNRPSSEPAGGLTRQLP